METVSSTPKARKKHWCEVCGWAIEPGETYERAVTFDGREAVTKFTAIILDRAFIRWRNVEIDRTGTLPEGFEMFRAGWNRAVAAVNGEHDHIEDGTSYLDCGACEMERKER